MPKRLYKNSSLSISFPVELLEILQLKFPAPTPTQSLLRALYAGLLLEPHQPNTVWTSRTNIIRHVRSVFFYKTNKILRLSRNPNLEPLKQETPKHEN